MKIGIGSFLLVVIYLLLSSAEVTARENEIRFMNMKVSPGLTCKLVYDDNIYLGNGSNSDSELKEDDWINHLLFSFFLESPTNIRGSIRLGYQGDFANYTSNGHNDWNTQKGFFNLDYQAPGGLLAEINNIYTKTADPYSSDNEYKLGVPQTRRWSNNLVSKLGYEFHYRLRIIGYLNYFEKDYSNIEDYTQDYKSEEFGVGIESRFLPRTWGFVRYYQGERDYFSFPDDGTVTESNDSDFSWRKLNVGLSWDPKAKMQGEFNVGYMWKDYENFSDINGDPYDDKQTWVAASRVSLSVTSATVLALSLTRALRESGSNTNEYFSDTGVGISLDQRLYTKVMLRISGIYNLNDYNTSRTDEVYRANIGIAYRIQDWLTFSMGYGYKSKVSNEKVYDYTDNQFMVMIKIGY